MDELEILSAKYVFFDNLLEYKLCMSDFSKLVNGIRKNIDEHLKEPFNMTEFSHMRFNDISNMLSNKLVSLVSTFNKKNINLFYFEDEEDHSLYISNFFCGNILRYYRHYFLEIAITLDKFTLLIMELDQKLKKYIKIHYFRSVVSMFKTGKFYLKDKECMELIEQIKEQYKKYAELESKFYFSELKDEYINIVKYNLDVSFEETPKKTFNAEELVTLYEVDCDFCKTFGYENLIPDITSVYQSYFLKKGFDPSIILDKGNHFFTIKEDSSFDPKKYINMSLNDLYGYRDYYGSLASVVMAKNSGYIMDYKLSEDGTKVFVIITNPEENQLKNSEDDETMGSQGPKKDLK